MDRIEILKWDKISLVVPEKSDIAIWQKAFSDIEFSASLISTFWDIVSYENEEEFYNFSVVKSKDTKLMCIMEKLTWKIIWNWSLKVDLKNRNAELGLSIFDEENRSKGYWKEALSLFMHFWFNVLGLHKIFLRVIWTNERAINAYKKVWFKESWRLREWLYLFWKYEDIVFMDILKSEYK